MGIVDDLLDRLRRLQTDRGPWDSAWLDSARYVLPDAERFDQMFATSGPDGRLLGGRAALDTVVMEPIGAKRSREIYDTTSLWAVDRGAAGTMALVTPQGDTWHDLMTDDPFAEDATDDEQRWYQKLRDYLFRIRSNPLSGFWPSQKASLRCTWAFGTAILYVEEANRDYRSPISYRYVPLSESYLDCNFEGVVDTNFRLFQKSALQCVGKWGGAMSTKVQEMAGDEKRKDQLVTLLHAVYPRTERGSYGVTSRDWPFASCYVEISEKHLIGEGGFQEFPYRIDRWQRNTPGPYAEGPITLALADIKSLNMLAMQELLGTQQWINPPIATLDDTLNRLNLNPRAINPGYVDAQGRLLAQPIITTQRPDFARTVIDARRNNLAESTYLNLWTTILDSQHEQTAYETMIKAAEKGDMLGPVGTSLQEGLAFQVDREIAILERRGAFRPGSPLAPPRSLSGRSVGVRFTSPLDRMREMNKLQGMTQLATIVAQMMQIKPEVGDKLNGDDFVDEAQRILGAPRKVMTSDADLAQIRAQRKQQQDQQQGILTAHAAGNAAQAGAAGADALAASPAASAILAKLSGTNLQSGAPAGA